MSTLFKKAYTATYSVIFGIFLAMIPQMLTENCVLGRNPESAAALALLALGCILSWFLGDLKRNIQRIRCWIKREENIT